MKNETFSFFASLFRGLNLFEFKLNYSSLAFNNSLSVIQIQCSLSKTGVIKDQGG